MPYILQHKQQINSESKSKNKIIMQCQICCLPNPLLYSISNCEHRFCMDCCVNHITSKAELFTDILCPDNTCKKLFTKPPAIWNILPPKVLENIRKRERFVYLSSNPHLKQCSNIYCKGLINTKSPKKICDTCNTQHCPKCLKPFHESPCIITNQDKQMRKLGYQKCPQCNVWVQKKQGCNYIDCKCGCNFCYSCGIGFENDPCRLKEVREIEMDLRGQLRKIKFNISNQKSDCVLKLLKFPLKIILLIIATIMVSLLSYILLVIGVGVGILVSPILILALSCQANDKCITALIIIFLPILTVLLIIAFVFALLLYPCLRKTNHHGAYDGIDIIVSKSAQIYVGFVQWVFE